jgi:hypothetical protein
MIGKSQTNQRGMHPNPQTLKTEDILRMWSFIEGIRNQKVTILVRYQVHGWQVKCCYSS